MKTLLALLLVLAPAFAGAVEAPSSGASGAYGKLVRDLLKDCGGDKKLAVGNFTYPDGRASGDGDVVSERLTTELVNMKKFRVTERREIEKVFDELKLQSSGAIGTDSVKSIGKLLGADWIILGTLTELSNKRIEINARLVGVESGEIINAVNAKVKKDWRDKASSGDGESPAIKKNDQLDEYDKAIRKYMDEKAGEKNHVVKEPPSF
jgi:curli biogenesis system outer membrane secretion channel CsgG